MYKKNPVFNVTTLSASNKSVAINALKKQKVSVSVIANLDAQIDIILDESTTKADKEKAIALLKNPNTILYTQVSRKSCIALCKKLEKLNFKDWLVSSYFKKDSTGTPEYSFLNLKKVDGNEVLFRLATPVVTYVIKNGTRVEFHIQWTYDIPPVYEDSSESGDDSSSSSSSSSDDSSSSSSENKHTVSIANNASEIITNIEPLSGEVNDGEDFTATVTFADEKSASDVEIEGGVIEGTTLTVSDVTADTTVTISAKE